MDILFIWHKLISFPALQIVHSALLYGPLQAKTNAKEGSNVDKLRVNFKSTLDSNLSELSNLHHKYEEMKRLLSPGCPAVEDISGQNTDVFDQFRNRLETEFADVSNVGSNIATEGKQVLPPTESIGDKRRRLKNRAVSAKH